METGPVERAARARADLITAIFFIALGLAVFYLSWAMPRLEERRIHPSTIPGLLPMVLGGLLTLFGALLAARSLRIDAAGGWQALAAALTGRQAGRIVALLALIFFHTLVLVGWVPFWAASFLFIFAFIIMFSDMSENRGRNVAWAFGIAVAASAVIYYVFERIFLVRLP